MTKIILIVIFIALSIYILYELWFIVNYVRIGKDLAERGAPYQFLGKPESLRIVIVGDSTGVGVGSEKPIESVAGRFHQDFPQATIINVAKNGARTDDVIQQLEKIKKQNINAQLVVIHTGGNDILRWTDLKKLEGSINSALNSAKSISPNVVLITAGNVGLAPFFPRSVGWLFTIRTLQVREMFKKAAESWSVTYVDLFTKRKDDIFLTDPLRYYAGDFLHLSGDGYQIWYEAIRKAMKDNNINLQG